MTKERREFQRAELNIPMHYRRAGSMTTLWQKGTLVDISAVGLRLATHESLEPDAKFEFEIVLPIRKNAYVLMGQVASEQVRQGQSEYGVAFIDLTYEKRAEIDELAQFLNKSNE